MRDIWHTSQHLDSLDRHISICIYIYVKYFYLSLYYTYPHDFTLRWLALAFHWLDPNRFALFIYFLYILDFVFFCLSSNLFFLISLFISVLLSCFFCLCVCVDVDGCLRVMLILLMWVSMLALFFLLFLFSFPPFALLFPSRFLRCVPRHDSYSATSSSSLPTRSFDFSCRSAGILRKNA